MSSSSCMEPPRMSRPRSRIGRSGPSLARMAASFSHELVAMHCPVSWSTSIERPRQPSILSSMGPASFLTNAMPASRLPGLPWNVVERAYTARSSLGQGSAWSGTAGDPCLLP